jgi:hypothetical protein
MGRTPTQLRIAWIDNLRALLIVLVVNMHACVTYSHIGRWYSLSPLRPDRRDALSYFDCGVSRAGFM